MGPVGFARLRWWSNTRGLDEGGLWGPNPVGTPAFNSGTPKRTNGIKWSSHTEVWDTVGVCVGCGWVDPPTNDGPAPYTQLTAPPARQAPSASPSPSAAGATPPATPAVLRALFPLHKEAALRALCDDRLFVRQVPPG